MDRWGKQRGFTLLEIMIVVAIIAILAGLAVVLYNGYLERARSAEIVEKYDAMRTRVGVMVAEGRLGNCADFVETLDRTALVYPYAKLEYDFVAVAGGYRPGLAVCGVAHTHGSLGVKVARAAYNTLLKNGQVDKHVLLTDTLVCFTARLTDAATPVCTAPLPVAGGAAKPALAQPPQPPAQTPASAQTAPQSPGGAQPQQTPAQKPAAPSLAVPPQVQPPQIAAPTPMPVAAPKLIDLGWYADLSKLTSDQLLHWMSKYMYPGHDIQLISRTYPTRDSQQKTAQDFQTRFTPPIPPQGIPTPMPVKIPPLSQPQQSAVDNMPRDQLIDWAIQNLYYGNENLRTFVQRMSEQQLRQMARDAQQR